MSVRIEAVGAGQAVPRAAHDANRARSPASAASEPNSTAIAPERAAELKRQLEERLNTDIARIRQRVDTRAGTASPSESVGRILDIRA